MPSPPRESGASPERSPDLSRRAVPTRTTSAGIGPLRRSRARAARSGANAQQATTAAFPIGQEDLGRQGLPKPQMGRAGTHRTRGGTAPSCAKRSPSAPPRGQGATRRRASTSHAQRGSRRPRRPRLPSLQWATSARGPAAAAHPCVPAAWLARPPGRAARLRARGRPGPGGKQHTFAVARL